MPLIPTAIRIGQLVYKYGKTAGKFASGETSFISRFPPRYRADVRTILKGASTVTYGGLISDALRNLNSDDGTGIDNGLPSRNAKHVPYKSSKTRRRFSRRTNKYCKCKQHRSYYR